MNKRTFQPLILIFVFTLLSAFSLHDHVDIQILKPVTGNNYTSGDTIHIAADLKSESPIHDISIQVTSLIDSSVVYSKVIHTHSTSAKVREYFVFSFPETVPLALKIQTKGHAGSPSASAEVRFKGGGKKKNKK